MERQRQASFASDPKPFPPFRWWGVRRVVGQGWGGLLLLLPGVGGAASAGEDAP